MILKKFCFQNAAEAQTSTGGGASTLMTDGTQTNTADTSSASTDATATDGATQQASTDTSAAKTDAKTDETAATTEKVVPEKYEFKQPEGVSLDADALGEFEGLAKELKLSQEEAQKVTDIGAKLAQKWEAKQAEVVQQAAAEWATAATADKEYGGDKLPENLATAKKALDTFGTPELRTLLNDSRLGNHPEVIRFMFRAGKAISEDGTLVRGGKSTETGSAAQRMYPTMNP